MLLNNATTPDVSDVMVYVATSFFGLTYSICDTNNHRIALERGNEMLDLGVMFDKKLTFK